MIKSAVLKTQIIIIVIIIISTKIVKYCNMLIKLKIEIQKMTLPWWWQSWTLNSTWTTWTVLIVVKSLEGSLKRMRKLPLFVFRDSSAGLRICAGGIPFTSLINSYHLSLNPNYPLSVKLLFMYSQGHTSCPCRVTKLILIIVFIHMYINM